MNPTKKIPFKPSRANYDCTFAQSVSLVRPAQIVVDIVGKRACLCVLAKLQPERRRQRLRELDLHFYFTSTWWLVRLPGIPCPMLFFFFFQFYEDIIQILLMLKVLFTQDFEVEDLFCGASAGIYPSLFFGDSLQLGLWAIQDDFQDDFP